MCCVLGTKEIGKWRWVKNGKKSTYNTTWQDSIIYQKSNVQTLDTTLPTTTLLVGPTTPTSPSAAGVQCNDTSSTRHSPYPQCSCMCTSRTSSPSTPSEHCGPKTPLFLPGSQDSTPPGNLAGRASSETASMSSKASFHTSNGEDVPVAMEVAVNPMVLSPILKSFIES